MIEAKKCLARGADISALTSSQNEAWRNKNQLLKNSKKNPQRLISFILMITNSD